MGEQPDLERPTQFIWRSARLLDRHRFAYLFLGGDREPVLAALRPYQNPDGGFGNALEADLRAPVSQPLPVWSALTVLDEVRTLDDPMVARSCDYLATITRPEGGVPFVLPSAAPYPRAPWWQTEDDPAGSLLPTAGIVAILHRNGVQHPWLDDATQFCWQRIEALGESNPYEMRMVFPFLESVSDRDRAEAAFARVGPPIIEKGMVALDPDAPGEVHTPLNFAPRPQSIARRLFADDVIEKHLDALAAGQQEDGGWMFNWLQWNAATTEEWRAVLTIESLEILRANGRLEKSA